MVKYIVLFAKNGGGEISPRFSNLSSNMILPRKYDFTKYKSICKHNSVTITRVYEVEGFMFSLRKLFKRERGYEVVRKGKPNDIVNCSSQCFGDCPTLCLTDCPHYCPADVCVNLCPHDSTCPSYTLCAGDSCPTQNCGQYTCITLQ